MKDSAPHKFRAASKGKIFTRKERETLCENARTAKDNALARHLFVAKEREKLSQERAAAAVASKVRAALLANPTVKKILIKKDGHGYFQAREKGKLQPATVVF